MKALQLTAQLANFALEITRSSTGALLISNGVKNPPKKTMEGGVRSSQAEFTSPQCPDGDDGDQNHDVRGSAVEI